MSGERDRAEVDERHATRRVEGRETRDSDADEADARDRAEPRRERAEPRHASASRVTQRV